MIFLVELDHVMSGNLSTPEASQTFIEQIILPTLSRADQLVAEKKILSGGPVAGRIALRFIMEADSSEHLDRMITSLPLWPLAETRVTTLIGLNDRREHVKELVERMSVAGSRKE
jgi:hypothetical protein